MKPYSNPALGKKFDEIERNRVSDQEAGKVITKIDTQNTMQEIMPGISPIWYDELAVMDLPVPTWIVEGLVPAAGITIISSPPAQYKTWLTFDIAIKVACGGALFRQFLCKQTNVLIIDEESGLGRARDRLQVLGIAAGTPIALASYNNFKLDEASAKSMIAFCKNRGVGLVIFDSLTRIHAGEENSAKDMSAVMGDLKRLAQDGIAVVIIHHNRKPGPGVGNGANEMRGSGDILAAADVQMSIKRKAGTNVVTVFQNKNRDAPEVGPFDLVVNSDEGRLWFEYAGNAPKKVDKPERTDAAIRELLAADGALFQEQIVGALKATDGIGGEKMITDRLKALFDAGELARTIGERGKHLYELRLEHTDG